MRSISFEYVFLHMDVVGGIVVWINLGPEKLDVTEPSKGSTQKKKNLG